MADEEWNPANVSALISESVGKILTGNLQGMTTAVQKINRKAILAKFQKHVNEAYGDS